ncbi:hypothetical protein RHSIM_Rhsim02G0032300 [Rhododendron simsii]|uniref:Uncharacterized protein n=1 Tax=Rhododendron simsii TaxID=118357 RepID=A0A834LS18_RHOSS|nr:hypothetical protein RHSIM_Rhsim02G0032300 [Rhododendron simsii]
MKNPSFISYRSFYGPTNVELHSTSPTHPPRILYPDSPPRPPQPLSLSLSLSRVPSSTVGCSFVFQEKDVFTGNFKGCFGDCEIRSLRDSSDRYDVFLRQQHRQSQEVHGQCNSLSLSLSLSLSASFSTQCVDYVSYPHHSYVVYPPEGPRPPSPEEMREMAREIARKNNMR